LENKKLYYSIHIFFFFCFFPYIDFLKLGTDAQPNALVMSLIPILFLKKESYPKEIYIYWFIGLTGTVLLTLSDLTNFWSYRSWFNYLSIAFITTATYKSLLKVGGLSFRFFKIVTYIWLVVGLIQTFIYETFLTFLLNRADGIKSNGRGVVALSPEPTYYGSVICLFLIVYMLNFYPKQKNTFVPLFLLQIFILSKSTTVLAIFALSIICYFVIKALSFKLKPLLITASVMIASVFFAYFTASFWEETRMYSVISQLIEHPELAFAIDDSVNERAIPIFFSTKSLFDNWGLPHGFVPFYKYMNIVNDSGEYFEYLTYYNPAGAYSKVQSGYGMLLYELGLIGFLGMVAIYNSYKFLFTQEVYIFLFVLINILLYSCLPWTMAMLPFICGNILYLRKVKNESSN
jgi:hypothetical protein